MPSVSASAGASRYLWRQVHPPVALKGASMPGTTCAVVTLSVSAKGLTELRFKTTRPISSRMSRAATSVEPHSKRLITVIRRNHV